MNLLPPQVRGDHTGDRNAIECPIIQGSGLPARAQATGGNIRVIGPRVVYGYDADKIGRALQISKIANMKFPHALVVSVLVLMVGACASKPPPPQKFTVGGYSILLPPKDGWIVVQELPEKVVLGKPGDFTGETLSLQMLEVQLPAQASGDDLLRHVRNSERQGMDPTRIRIVTQEVKPHAVGRMACAISRLEADDRSGSGTSSGPVAGIVMEALTVTCPNPAQPGRGISLAYVHRCIPKIATRSSWKRRR